MNSQTASNAGREKALLLLREELSRGTKPTKGIKPFDGVKKDKDGKRIKLDMVKLDASDRHRIETSIANLERKLENSLMNKLVTVSQNLNTSPRFTKPVKPGNPKSKLYQFINGVYHKIAGK